MRAATFIGASPLFMSVVSSASPLAMDLALDNSSIMSVVSGASPLIMSVVSLVMSVVSGAAYNFGGSLLTSTLDLEAVIEVFLEIKFTPKKYMNFQPFMKKHVCLALIH